MSKIELRLSDVDPPEPDPPRTIYRDILNLPSTTYLGLTIRYFNFDDVTLYFRITGTGPGYTFGTVDLGSLASGTSAYRNLDNFASRSRPASELTETVDLILRAYTDAGYTNLKWTYTRTVTVIWINSADPSYTQDYLNNFDDGTVQGWACVCEAQCLVGQPTIAVVSDYVLSPPNSLRMRSQRAAAYTWARTRLYKSFATPDRNRIYGIMDVRLGSSTPAQVGHRVLVVRRGAAEVLHFGKVSGDTNYAVDDVPEGKWMRFVIALPRNQTFEIQLAHSFATYVDTNIAYLWLDDFKIISKD